MRPLIDTIAFVQICKDCGQRHYWLDYPLKAYSGLQRYFAQKGTGMKCNGCEGTNTEMKQLKLEQWVTLREKFHKKVIYTKKTVEELLALPDGANPDDR